MQSITSLGKDIAQGARLAVDSTTYLGRTAGRLAFSPFTGVCTVCNNLQPRGHEDTASRRRGFFDLWHDDSLVRTRLEAGAVPSLELQNIPMQDIIKFRRSGKDGKPESECSFCKVVCNVLETMFPEYKQDWELGEDTHRQIGLMIREGKPLIICCKNFTVDSGWANARVDIELYYEVGQVFKAPANMPSLGPAAHRSEAADSAESVEFMMECFQQCKDEHDTCRSHVASHAFVPSRLIYIGNAQIRLAENLPSGTAWVALSHCWGGMNVLKLEQRTLSRMKRVIEHRDLPATFKDAISVSQCLGIEYIWIDSLCIIQDSEADWQQESAQMGEIYRDATLVITAAASPNPETPFLAAYDEDWLPKLVATLTADSGPVELFARRRQNLAVGVDQGLKEPPFTPSWATLRRVGPIYKRAWVFQETLLARRGLNFTPGGLVFECKTHRRIEGQLPPYASTLEDTLGAKSPQEKWRMTVNAYTYRDLTFDKDRLVALSGIAATMSDELGGDYLAGLWRSSLLHDLLWHATPGATMEVLTYSDYVAPTWSWASLNRGVVWNPLKNPQSLITILRAETNLKGINKFGEVTSGEIKLRGRITPCRIHLKAWNAEYNAYITKNGKRGKDCWFLPDGRLVGGHLDGSPDAVVRKVRLDEKPLYQDFDAPAWLLCVAKTSWANYDHIGLLVCRSDKGPECWERLGCVSNLRREWFELGVEQELKLL